MPSIIISILKRGPVPWRGKHADNNVLPPLGLIEFLLYIVEEFSVRASTYSQTASVKVKQINFSFV